jgi:transposase
MSHWNYRELFEKLEDKLLTTGVQVNKLSPTYTSQRCSVCGWVRKDNRKRKIFKCTSCGHTQDADLNASLNLSFTLPLINKEVRLKQTNRKGFYWLAACQEPIVPDAQKSLII